MWLLQRLRGSSIESHGRPLDVVFGGPLSRVWTFRRVFLGVAAKNHIDGSLCVGTLSPSLISSGRSAFLVPRLSFRVVSCAIVFPVDETSIASLAGQLMQDTLEFGALGQGMAMLFVVITPQIVVATIRGGGSRRWNR